MSWLFSEEGGPRPPTAGRRSLDGARRFQEGGPSARSQEMAAVQEITVKRFGSDR